MVDALANFVLSILLCCTLVTYSAAIDLTKQIYEILEDTIDKEMPKIMGLAQKYGNVVMPLVEQFVNRGNSASVASSTIPQGSSATSTDIPYFSSVAEAVDRDSWISDISSMDSTVIPGLRNTAGNRSGRRVRRHNRGLSRRSTRLPKKTDGATANHAMNPWSQPPPITAVQPLDAPARS